MSMDEAGSGKPLEISEEPKKPRKPKPLEITDVPMARKHKLENVNRNRLADVLDAYAAEGRVLIALNISRDIGGTYEVVSYKNEPPR